MASSENRHALLGALASLEMFVRLVEMGGTFDDESGKECLLSAKESLTLLRERLERGAGTPREPSQD